jgi:hypothetical protein
LENRRLAARRPSSHPVRTRAQAAFVDENNGAPLAACFFLVLAKWHASNARSSLHHVQWRAGSGVDN